MGCNYLYSYGTSSIVGFMHPFNILLMRWSVFTRKQFLNYALTTHAERRKNDLNELCKKKQCFLCYAVPFPAIIQGICILNVGSAIKTINWY